MFPCGSQLAACFLLFKLVPFSISKCDAKSHRGARA
ncbi:hypothetical protein PUN28_017143 [Cardiocondyla obscurior]|uniref:Uncharacterized protein n=1 Tax=Cardiocondyla obscurior TaxID=286306 RepID=A0AAW2EP73_9HYME